MPPAKLGGYKHRELVGRCFTNTEETSKELELLARKAPADLAPVIARLLRLHAERIVILGEHQAFLQSLPNERKHNHE